MECLVKCFSCDLLYVFHTKKANLHEYLEKRDLSQYGDVIAYFCFSIEITFCNMKFRYVRGTFLYSCYSLYTRCFDSGERNRKLTCKYIWFYRR